MSNISTIAQILEMTDDMPVQAVRGKIIKVYPAKRGEGQHGPYSYQDADFTDGKATIKVSFSNRDDFDKTLLNKTVTFLANHGEKGWNGLKTKDNEYNGKTTRKLMITKQAEIHVGDVVNAESPAPQSPQTPATTPKPAQDASQSSPAASASSKAANMRCTEVRYERKVYVGNYGTETISVTIQPLGDTTAKEALNQARKFVEAELKAEGVDKSKGGA